MFGRKRDKDAEPVKRRPRTPKTSHLYIDKEEMMDELCKYKETGEIISYKYSNTLIKVTKNLRHKTYELDKNVMYYELRTLAQK